MNNQHMRLTRVGTKVILSTAMFVLFIILSGCSNNRPLGRIAFLWSPTGIFSDPSSTRLILSDGDGNNLRFAGYFTGVPAFSPDGKYIAIGCPYSYTGEDTISTICILDIDKFMSSRQWIPAKDNYDMYFAVVSRVSLPEQCSPFQQYQSDQSLEGILSIDWSPKADKLLIVCGNLKKQKVCILPLKGDASCWNDFPGNGVFRAVWSPIDDNLIAIAGLDYPTSKIFLVDANGNNPRYLTDGLAPEWSPDGHQIAYIENKVDPTTHDTTYERIASINSDGSNHKFLFEPENTPDLSVDLISFENARPVRLAWSPDGRYITFSGITEGDVHQIFRLDISTGKVIFLVDTNIFTNYIGEPDWGK